MKTRTEIEALAATLGGVPLWTCLPDSPAHAAGLRYGDIVLAVNGVPTPTAAHYMAARKKDPDQALVRFFRDGDEHEVVLELRGRSSMTAMDRMARQVANSRALVPPQTGGAPLSKPN